MPREQIPADVEAEHALLVVLLADPSAMARAAHLDASAFFRAEHAVIWGAMRDLHERGDSVCLSTLRHELVRSSLLAAAGGDTLLVRLNTDPEPEPEALSSYVQRVEGAATRRAMRDVGWGIAQRATADSAADTRELAAEALAEVRAVAEPALRRRGGMAPADVLEQWAEHGRLVHEPTGIDRLDDLTDGGPVYGSRWFIQGAPDAGKTALLVQFAHDFARRGITVGLLAVDEEPGDVLTRLAQREGWSRKACEARAAHELENMRQGLGALPIRFFDADWTIEAAAAALAADAQARGARAVLCIDSVQTVQCEAERGARRELGMNERVEGRARAIRAVASEHRLIAIATSEMGRSAYAGRKGEGVADMAAAKWSGAIEYQARVMLTVRSVPGESDLIELTVTKNKHGPSGDKVHLRLDRARQSLAVAGDYEPPTDEEQADARARRQMEAARTRSTADAATVAVVLAECPGMSVRRVRAAAKARGGFGNERADAALERLGPAVERHPGARNAWLHHLNGSQVPQDVMAHVPAALVPLVRDARPIVEAAE